MLRESSARTGFFDPHQQASVLPHLPSEIQAVLNFAAITGWRISAEVLTLQWRHVDFEAGKVRLDPDHSKNLEGRTFRMTRALRHLLDGQHAEHERLKKTGHIFTFVFFREIAKGRGGPKEPRVIKRFEKQWRNACRLAGCRNAYPTICGEPPSAPWFGPVSRSELRWR